MSGRSHFRSDLPEVVVKSVFSKYDIDGSGSLEKNEILAMLQDGMGLNESQAEVCFMLVDKDGSNSISLNELLLWFRKSEGFKMFDGGDQDRYEYVRKAADWFKAYDKDASGAIDRREFRALLASGNKEWSRCDEAQIEMALKSVDKDGSGTVSFSEFLVWLETPR